MTTLTISDDAAQRLAKVADTQFTSTDTLAEKAIREFLRAEADRTLERELDAYRAMHAELLRDYANQFVAVRQRRVIDHDHDQLSLYLRVEQEYPDEIILIKQVLPAIEEIYRVRSPKLQYE